MRIVSWNLNGLRAAIRKGLVEWMKQIDADIWLFQEIRALPEQVSLNWQEDLGFQMIWHPAMKKGYSGVASLSRIGIEEISLGI